VLDELYGTKVLPAAMGAETRFTAVSLGGDPRDLDKGPVKLKLSFESANQEDYAELYTNVALVSRRLEFREKDEIYRPQLIRALQRH
jgi:hypothetical protein